MLRSSEFERDPGQFFEWVKFRSHLSRGVTVGTMLMDEALHFMRLGTFLERADNTARLVDVKFHAVQSDFFGAATEQDQEYDFYHWSAILRSVSGFEIYRKVYRDVIKPERVADLLILRPDMPRSLHASMNEVVRQPADGGQRPVGRDPAPRRQAARRPAVRQHRRDPRHRPARLPHAVPGPRERAGRAHQPRLPRSRHGVMLQHAQALVQGGRFHEALAAFRQVLAQDPLSVPARLGLARACAGAGDGFAAIAWLSDACRLAPDDSGPAVLLAEALLGQDQYAQALPIYSRLHDAIGARDRATLLHYGFCLEQTGDIEGAVARYREAVARDPGFFEAHVDLAGVLWRVGEFERALAHARAAVRPGARAPVRRAHPGHGPAATSTGSTRPRCSCAARWR